MRLQRILTLVTREVDDPEGTRVFGRIGAGLFLSAGVVVLVTQPFVADAAKRAGPYEITLSVAGALTILAGIVTIPLPWGRWPRPVLMVQPALACVLIAVCTRLIPAALDFYLAMYMIPFTFIGVTQRLRHVVWATVAIVASFLAGALGVVTTETYLNFSVTASVGVIGSLMLNAIAEHHRRAHRQIEALLDATRRLGRSASLDAAIAELEATVLRITGADTAVTVLAEIPGSTRLVVVTGVASELAERVEVADIDGGPTAAVLGGGDQWFVADAAADELSRRLDLGARQRSCLYVPLPADRGSLGAVVLGWRSPRHGIDPVAGRALAVIANEAAVVFERLREAERVRREAETDGLTGLLNRRAIDRRFRTLAPGDAVVLIDLDDFKRVNDREGHQRGDQLLRALGRCLHQASRTDDWCGRLGGDEFVMVLRGGGSDAIATVTRKVRHRWAMVTTVTTLSIGAGVHRRGDQPRDTLAVADRALYRAKHAGRNRVEIDVEVSERVAQES